MRYSKRSIMLAAVASLAACNEAGEDMGDDADTGSMTDMGSVPETFIRATFTGMDGTTIMLDVDGDLNRSFDDVTTCQGIDVATSFGVRVHWDPMNPPGLDPIDLSQVAYPLDVFVQWPTDDGFRLAGGHNGTVTFTEFGASSGDVIAGTFVVDVEPIPGDPQDWIELVDAGEFRCVVP